MLRNRAEARGVFTVTPDGTTSARQRRLCAFDGRRLVVDATAMCPRSRVLSWNAGQSRGVSTLMSVERKLAAVLFVDLVGSTSLVASADPEVVRRRLNRFFDEVTHSVETHGGIVEKFAGDAVLAAFGARVTHEDDAERAIKAAFAILEQVHELGLEARIGIEAGGGVVGESDPTFAPGGAVHVAPPPQPFAAPRESLSRPAPP